MSLSIPQFLNLTIVVQVRQKVLHKRTFLWLEQLIMKYNAHKDTTNIKEIKDGVDFFYTSKGNAIKMVEFLSSMVPMRVKTSEQLISTDIHTSTSNYKFTFSVEIVPVCKVLLITLFSLTLLLTSFYYLSVAMTCYPSFFPY